MKTIKITLLFFITATLSFGAYSQIADSIYYERLYYTCKVWGHAKYYHSRIADGEVDWDDVLLAALPGIKNAPHNNAFNDSLLVMLQQAGETERGTEVLPEVPDSLNNNVDISWIYNTIFSNGVSALLDTIIQRFTPRPNVYVGVKPWGDNRLNFQDSDNKYYSGTQYPDENIRILALFRFWNIIHYFFPYRYIMDQDWDTSLVQTIPEIVKASNAEEYHLAMKEFTVKINDSHSFFNSTTFLSWRGSYYPPFRARFIEGEVVITKVHPSASQSIREGDIIKKIDGFDIRILRDSLKKYCHGSNEITVESILISTILFGNMGTFPLTVLNETGEQALYLTRVSYPFGQDNTPYWREITLNGCRFGIVNMGTLYEKHIPEVIEKFNNVDAVIFDIRRYPNGTLWTLVDYLFESSIHHSNLKWPDKDYPGRFFWVEHYIGEGTPNPKKIKTIILFDEGTQSQAEFTCMGLEQIPGSIKIGSTTAAADGDISYIKLPGGIEVAASFLGVYYPDYTPTQRVGIIPDYFVQPTIRGIREGRDEVLEFALDCKWLGIEDVVKKEEDISVYPNPTSGHLRITNYELRILGVEVFDVLGRKYCFDYAQQQKGEWKKEIGEVVIDISTLPAGFYLLKIMTDGNTYTHKIVKN